MGRVETRLYKRKLRRSKAIRAAVLICLLGAAVWLAWMRLPHGFITEMIALPTATPLTSAYDQTVETREVTLPEETWFAIQTGVFSTQEAAAQKADAYTQRGAPGTVVQEGDKWRVFIACYGTEADASAVRTRLEQNQKVDTYLYSWKCPQLRMRLTGKRGQLDVVEAGFTLLTSTAAALRDTATSLDAAQLTTQEVMTAVTALDGQISLWEDTVRSRFGKSVPPLMESMLTITANWDERRSHVQASEGATALSAALKAEAMGMYDEIIAWRRVLSAQ
ncbi:MAG: SPOR domain-containing protein [Aristaeellaceae bacterium]